MKFYIIEIHSNNSTTGSQHPFILSKLCIRDQSYIHERNAGIKYSFFFKYGHIVLIYF